MNKASTVIGDLLNIQPPPPVQIKKTYFKADTVYYNTGKRHKLYSTFEEAFEASEFQREIQSVPVRYFTRIIEVERRAVEVRNGIIQFGAPREVNTRYFV